MSAYDMDERINGGSHWSMVIAQGKALKLIDLYGGANIGMLFYNPRNTLERYNAPDTLKCQHTFKLTRGHCLYSDMGRIFCSIIDDECGWHDTVCGNANAELVAERWGKKSYQEARNQWHQNGYDAFLVELGKYGLGPRDMAANVNWFSQVRTDDDGQLLFCPEQDQAGRSVTLRFEMDTLVVFHSCPHPLNQAQPYPRKAIQYQIFDAPAIAADDVCLDACAENQRGKQNTDFFNAMQTGVSS